MIRAWLDDRNARAKAKADAKATENADRLCWAANHLSGCSFRYDGEYPEGLDAYDIKAWLRELKELRATTKEQGRHE